MKDEGNLVLGTKKFQEKLKMDNVTSKIYSNNFVDKKNLDLKEN